MALLVLGLGLRVGVRFAVMGIVSGIVALAMVQLLAHGMTSPLREMVGAAESMAKGDYSQRVSSTSRDEVGDLARAFNAMAEELEDADRMRRDLVANVSHELRTPISALQAVLENLVDGVAPPDPESLRTMLAQVERLGRLVSQLLDLSRLESGAVPLAKIPFLLNDVFEQALNEARLQPFDVRFECVVEPEGLTAAGDPERVHQVIANLLENAIRHSPPGGSVRLSAESQGSDVVIEVTDQGPGIAEHEAERVFERFYRTDRSRSPAQGGTGLGLSIARWIVELHGGVIHAENDLGRGCRMVVRLPRDLAD